MLNKTLFKFFISKFRHVTGLQRSQNEFSTNTLKRQLHTNACSVIATFTKLNDKLNQRFLEAYSRI